VTARKARPADLAEIALGLPEVEEGVFWGRPAYLVGKKAFVLFRAPRPDAIDPDTGERMDDVIVVNVADRGEKDALVASGGPWFTTPHFEGSDAVLVRARDLGRLTRRELEEVVTDAWAARAPKRLVEAYFDEA
jgi:hypothetical protein